MKSITFFIQLLRPYQQWILLITLLMISNVATVLLLTSPNTNPTNAKQEQLYLLDEAATYVLNVKNFERKVKRVSQQLDVPPEWLMAVMHSESRFDASVRNHKGSGATGLIQWMPTTAQDFSITVEQLRNLNHEQQLDYVYEYLNAKKGSDKSYESLTDLYLAILYPRAIGEAYCYTLYEQPAKAYQMNSGLDMNKDGSVTVQDIDQFLKRVYPTAYQVNKPLKNYARLFKLVY